MIFNNNINLYYDITIYTFKPVYTNVLANRYAALRTWTSGQMYFSRVGGDLENDAGQGIIIQ